MLRLGDGLSYLQAKAAQGHEPSIRELEGLVDPECPFIWQAYWDLRKGSPQGLNGPSRIIISEILAYCDLFEIRSQRIRSRLLSNVQAMDNAYLETLADQV